MRILYGIQGTGNGHFARAKEIIPVLARHAELDLVVSGSQVEMDLGQPVRYRFSGLGFVFGRNGGIDHGATFRGLKPVRLVEDIRRLPVEVYDLVVSDFEPVTSWACKMKGVPCIGLSHQASFLSERVPRPSHRDPFAELLFRHYAPVTRAIGLHYEPYDSFIRTPVIRQDVRKLRPRRGNHVTVYLPAYGEEHLIPHLHRFPSIRWHLFSKHAGSVRVDGNVEIRPVSHRAYLDSLEGSLGLVSGGGFEAPAEALHLGKRLLVIPMRNQYEQQCNAEALRRLGVATHAMVDRDFGTVLEQWLDGPETPHIRFPEQVEALAESLLGFAGQTTRSATTVMSSASSYSL